MGVPSKEPNIWVLKTNHVGDTNNRRAIAQAISPNNHHIIDFNETRGNVEQMLLARSGQPSLTTVTEWPDIFIMCEQEPPHLAIELKKLGRDRTFVVGLQTPDIDRNYFDNVMSRGCVDMQVLFGHHQSAKLPVNYKKTPEILRKRKEYDYVPTYVNQHALDEALKEAPEEIKQLSHKKPVYFLAVGSVVDASLLRGHRLWETYPEEVALMEKNVRQMVRKVAQAAKKNGGVVLVSTSRRTSDEFSALIRDELTGVDSYLYEWSDKNKVKNPYLSMLAAADQIIISGDSISMTSDALATGKPTYIYTPSRNPEHDKNSTLSNVLDEFPLMKPEVVAYMKKLAKSGVVHHINEVDTVSSGHEINSAPDIGRDVMDAYHAYQVKGLER